LRYSWPLISGRMLTMASENGRRPRYRAPALEKGLDILEVLAGSRLPLSQVELAQTLGRSQGELFRMLTCLEDRGYVGRESESGRFKVTLRLYQLGHQQNAASLLRNAARVPMEWLTEQIGQACHLSVQSGFSLLILMERMPPQRVCLAVGEGSTFPLLETTSGRLLLSQLSQEEVATFVTNDETRAQKSPGERKRILSAVQGFRKNGYAVAKSSVTGVTDIATTVGVRGTDTLAVLVVPCLTRAHQKRSNNARYFEAVRQSAAEINRNLGIIG
jgi:DNA-binding IclR family transcriptional regulator